MNFLQLCQRVRSEARISGTGPVSVLGQRGEMASVVDWVNDAYVDIQNKTNRWDFLRKDFSFDTIATVSNYTKLSVDLATLLDWRIEDEFSMRCYQGSVNNEQNLTPVSWETMKDIRLFASSRNQTGRPTEYAEKPDKSLVFWPIPDGIYTIVGEYYEKPKRLVNNTDEPIFDDSYHMAIVWLACRYSAAYQSAPEKFAFGDSEYRRILGNLKRKYLPQMQMGGPLA